MDRSGKSSSSFMARFLFIDKKQRSSNRKYMTNCFSQSSEYVSCVTFRLLRFSFFPLRDNTWKTLALILRASLLFNPMEFVDSKKDLPLSFFFFCSDYVFRQGDKKLKTPMEPKFLHFSVNYFVSNYLQLL